MPFGLKNAGATYQRMVNRVFHNQIRRNMEAYVDEMVVKSTSTTIHIQDLEETFKVMKEVGMRLNPTKSFFGLSGGKFLGFIMSERGIEIHPSKCSAILEMPLPKPVKKVQTLTGRIAALNRLG
jgi:(p)ppGpp synthase/HD superfamily hydrolase